MKPVPSGTQASRLPLCLLLGVALAPVAALAQHAAPRPDATAFTLPQAAPGRAEAERDLKRLALPPGWTASVWAAEPDVVHPVAFDIAHDGRVFVAESLRAWRGVPDIRNLMPWLDDDLAARTVDDRLALMRRLWGDEGLRLHQLQSERVRLLQDTDADGKADRARIFAEGFNSPLDGVASSVLARGRDVWFANIPDIWRLTDTDGDGVADQRRSLSHGHGVRISMLGHDLHGLAWGPDGRLYVSVGDRASMILHDGRWIGHPECGAVFRFNPDGSGLEMFAFGLRNPQELVFDDWGNLFTGDNNANVGDESRWVHVVPDGDSGWRIGWQWAENRAGINDGVWREGPSGPGATSPWMTEGFWKPAHPGQPAHIVPPVDTISAGPCGNTLYPGTGLDPSWDGQYLLTDFRGSSNDSLLWRFRLAPHGAGFRLLDRTQWLRGANLTDIAFGPSGDLWTLDWTDGWEPVGRGRIQVLAPPDGPHRKAGQETAALLKAGFNHLPAPRLIALLAHADRRVRQEAQFELAARGADALEPITAAVANRDNPAPTRRHAAWALWQLARRSQAGDPIPQARTVAPLLALLADPNPDLRTVAARILGDVRHAPAAQPLLNALRDPSPTVAREAALALGRIGHAPATDPLVELARDRADADPILRHAAVMGLLGCTDVPGLLRHASHPSPAVRLALTVALRRLERPEIARFLDDPAPVVRAEAARAIHDLPIASALHDLAAVPDERLLEPAFARRIVNACLRLGTPAAASRLARIASLTNSPEPVRADALAALAAWPGNAGRDRITGLWRPATPRNIRDAADALRPHLPKLLASAADSVVIEAAGSAAALQLADLGPDLRRTALDPRRHSRVRIAALQAAATLQAPDLVQTLDTLCASPEPSVRATALRLAARASGPAAIPLLKRVLETGTTSDRQAAFAGLARIGHPEATALLRQWLEQATQGHVPAPLVLDLLEAAGSPEHAVLAPAIAAFNDRNARDPLGPFLPALEGGDAAAGQSVFQRPEVECFRCHKIWSRGGEVGPDLTTIGARLDRRALLEAIVTPNARLAQGYETVLVTLDDGETVAGVAIADSGQSLTLRLPDGSRTEIPRNRIRSRDRGQSAMPSGLAEILGPRQLRDLVEYLSTLR